MFCTFACGPLTSVSLRIGLNSLSCKIQHFSGSVLGVYHPLGLGPWALGVMFTSTIEGKLMARLTDFHRQQSSSDGFVGKPPNPACSVRPPTKPLTRPPPCTGSLVHDFVLLVSPPCGPHPVPLSTGSLEPSLLVSPSPGGPSTLKTFRGRSSPATTRTRTQPTPAH
jgi:hypothetical protein